MDYFEAMLEVEIPEPTFTEVIVEPVYEPEAEEVQPPEEVNEPEPEEPSEPIYLKRGDNGTLYNQDAEDMEIKFRSDFADAVTETMRKHIARRNKIRELQARMNLK
jgi:hypothetical protein